MYNFIITNIRQFELKELIAFGLLLILASASLVLLIITINNARETSVQNQGYLRYVACVVDIRNEMGTVVVSDDLSDNCWDQAEKETGTKLQRYTAKLKGENI